MSDRLGLGLIGCGVIAATYLRELHAPAQNDWRLAAVCDVDLVKAREAAAGEATAYTELDDLLDDPAVDAVAVLLPNYLHADAALRALAAGKPVLVEKPMATTLEDCDRMIEGARRANKLLMVGMTARFCSAFRETRARLHAGEFGTLNFIHESCDYRTAPGWYVRPWLKRPETCGGGMFLQMGIHGLDRAVWLSGCAPRWAHAAVRNATNTWDDETVLAMIGLEGGALVQFQTDRHATLTRNETILHCSEATVSLTRRRVQVHGPGEQVREYRDDSFANELREFAAAVRGGATSPLSGVEGRQALALCLACYESDRRGARVALNTPPWNGMAPEAA